ncbi:RNA polymerase II elongation factor [Phlyctochytrium planicorne]|nr:RNA polymerase II elongation factor [Phlyctochytrium planicorne]
MADVDIINHVKEIEKSIQEGDVKVEIKNAFRPVNASQMVLRVMQHLEGWKPTAESLKKTNAGICLNNLRKHPNSSDEIKTLARGYITKWKEELMKADKAAPEKKPLPKVTIERKNSNSPAPSTPTPITPNLRDRNFKVDKVNPKSVGDKVRDKTIELFYAAVGLGSDESSTSILSTATNIEAALYKEYNGVSDKYKSQFRTLSANLKDKDNPKLRENLLNGTITPEAFVVMGPDDLMSDELRKAAAEAKRKNMMNSMTAPPQEAETDSFKCGKCGKRKCTYYQKQTRSADEPMTTFVVCIVVVAF